MMKLSTGIITDALFLLHSITANNIILKTDLVYLHITHATSLETTFSFLESMHWLAENEGVIQLSAEGCQLGREFDCISISLQMWRRILEQYILQIKPIWSARIPFGRQEASVHMSMDETRCFMEAGLLTMPPSMAAIEWWDRIATKIRKIHDQRKNEIGRIGERLSIAYETKRTGIIPTWQAIETNLSGYDLISRRNKVDHTRLMIEVKATTALISESSFHISRNEWDVALLNENDNYVFHLWYIGNDYRIAIISPKQLSPFIPTDGICSRWESVEIQFSAFLKQFTIFDIEYDKI